ncbi:MAG: ABC transporter ATP-binding protein [Burkholderiaceae bacterium]|jgi:glycerol transport system ATP-binding protein|nr:ABC transporter ATP-binding protein [Burkholderiaceae bacterium]MDO7671669.1 ABC transporter ATP-binding protein [Burkholderiaceae bacterium]|tara:strand:- start:1629 stop:2717 length:1089 start_codon:yes stop_codon:yes gene_type:complete
MNLELKDIAQRVGTETHLFPQSLTLEPGAVNVLLGATKAGKTSLMRIMAGLDKPSEGAIFSDGINVTGVSVRKRNVAMVYQQFINYPTMTVQENIAAPLRLRGALDIESRVVALATRLHIESFLQRLPAELSGGQQQRVALARALAKEAPLMMFDEPLVNLDYKLREELREELAAVFSTGESTVVYATTEPAEALMLGGYTAVLDKGELLQYGRTPDIFHRPHSLRVAQAFSDPPMNLLAASRETDALVLAGNVRVPLELAGTNAKTITLGLRANAIRLRPRANDIEVSTTVELAEISGSDTFLHLKSELGELVAQLTGVHNVRIGVALLVYLDLSQAYLFDEAGALLLAPGTTEGSLNGAH